jgi:hypothetical protein
VLGGSQGRVGVDGGAVKQVGGVTPEQGDIHLAHAGPESWRANIGQHSTLGPEGAARAFHQSGLAHQGDGLAHEALVSDASQPYSSRACS